jgi:hypothetical protein
MGPWLVYLLFAAIAFASLWIVVAEIARQYRSYRRTRIVTCPETRQNAAVAVTPSKAALPAAFGSPPVLEVSDCSRWDDARDCDQRCLPQIASAPEETTLRAFLAERYTTRLCAQCQKPFPGSDQEPIPAVLGPGATLIEVMDIPPERLEEIIATHLPLCARCYSRTPLQPGQRAFFASARRIGNL